MWEIPRCKKWPGPRVFFSSFLGTTNHDTHDFVLLFFFLLGDFLGFRIYGDFWVILFFWGDFCFQSGMSESEWVIFLFFFGTQECQNGFCMRRQWCPAENANWASTEAKKMWKL